MFLNKKKKNKYKESIIMNKTTGLWVGWIAILLGVISFFWQPVWMGVAAIILGIIGLLSPKKGINWVAIIIGVLSLIVSLL